MKVFRGEVISRKTDKTIKVRVTRMKKHRLYKKRYMVSKDYLVHDDLGVKVGDVVNFVACKPISKKKKWKTISDVKRVDVKEKDVKKKKQTR